MVLKLKHTGIHSMRDSSFMPLGSKMNIVRCQCYETTGCIYLPGKVKIKSTNHSL